MKMLNFLAPIITAFFIVFLTEFSVRSAMYARLFSIYPLQKFKTIRKKVKRGTLRKKILLTVLLDYDSTTKTKLVIVLCYVYRVYSLIVLFWPIGHIYSSITLSIWMLFSVIPLIIVQRKTR